MYQRVPGLSPDGRLAAAWKPCPRCCESQRVEMFQVNSHYERYPDWCQACRDDEKRRVSRERVAREAEMTQGMIAAQSTRPYPKVAKPSRKARRRVERD